jgi:hypothetical protein
MGNWSQVWLIGANSGLFRSADGASWERIGAYEFRVTSILRDNGRLCVGVGGGAWEVRDDPDPWVQLHDETLTEVLDLARIPGDPGLVAASAYGVATGARDGLGAVRWSWHSDPLAVNERFTNAVAVDPADPRRWGVGTEAGVLVAEEGGRRWIYSNLMGVAGRAVRRALGAWWAGTDGQGIWTSPDGLSWRKAGYGLDDGTVFALAESHGRILAGTLRGVVVGDGRGHWRNLGPRALIASVAAHPQQPDFWMAGAVPGGLWVTRDAGESWRQASGLPSTIEAISPPEED